MNEHNQRQPLIGLPMDSLEKDGLTFHSIGDKYLRAITDVVEGLPIPLPAFDAPAAIDEMLSRLDGIVMTGATSNVHPSRYGHQPSLGHEPYDLKRDSMALRLIQSVLDQGMPLLCICRGFQELNVVLGGTLAAEVQDQPGILDHRAPVSPDLDTRYGPAHDIDIIDGGLLHRIIGQRRIKVNTVHRQAVAELALDLLVEAKAPDGIIEAVSVKNAKGFALGVQWHPEYEAWENPVSIRLFKAFRQAVEQYAQAKAAAA